MKADGQAHNYGVAKHFTHCHSMVGTTTFNNGALNKKKNTGDTV